MEIARNIATCRAAVAAARRADRRIVLVPTMGALHRGHTSLMSAAKPPDSAPPPGAPFLVVSIFVNPTQFGPNEDFARYPRAEAADRALCAQAGAELIFAPDVDEMYPAGDRGNVGVRGGLTSIHVARLSETLCGPHRPGHFDGVATVVAKLLNIVQPDAAYFGQKDYQQLAIIRRMVRDLDLPVEIVGCPTVREADGLALSSRNQYLNPSERAQAASLYRGLQAGAARIAAGEQDAGAIRATIRAGIDAAGPARVEYISIVDPDSLQAVEQVDGPVQLALAVRMGSTRLIDNLRVDPPEATP